MFRSATMQYKKEQLSKAVLNNQVDFVHHLLLIRTEVEASHLTLAIAKGHVDIIKLLACKLPKNILSDALIELAMDKDYETEEDWRKRARGSDSDSRHPEIVLAIAKVLVDAGADVRASKDDIDVLNFAKASGFLQPLVHYIESVLKADDKVQRSSTKKMRYGIE